MISKKKIDAYCKENYNRIYSYCRSLGLSDEESLDITQEVFLFFIEKAVMLSDDNIAAYMYAVAHNKVREYKREKYKQNGISFMQNDNIDINDNIVLFEDCAIDADIEKNFNELLAKLKEKDREFFKDMYIKKLSYEELEKKYCTSRNALYARAFRIRAKVYKHLGFNSILLFKFLGF